MGSENLSVEFVDPTLPAGADQVRAHAGDLAGSGADAGAELVRKPGFFFAAAPFFKTDARDIRFALVRERNHPRAMLPLEIGRERNFPGTYFQIYQHPTKLSGTGVTCADDRLEEVLQGVFSRLRAEWSDAVGVSLVGLDEASKLYDAVRRLFRQELLLKREPKVQYYIDLAEYPTAADYLASRSGNYKKNLKRAHRKMEEAGGFSISTEGPDGPLSFEDIRRIDQKTWRAREKEGDTPARMLDMCEKLADLAEAPEDRELYALEMNGKPVSLYFTLTQAGVKYGFKNTFDPDYAEYSPGHVAFHHLVETAIERGLRRVELLSGSAYMGRLANRERQLSEDVIFFRTIRGRGAYVAAKGARKLRDLVKDTVGKDDEAGEKVPPQSPRKGEGAEG